LKERASFTFDRETIEILDELVRLGRYRNRSHAVEEAIKSLKEKETKSKEKGDK